MLVWGAIAATVAALLVRDPVPSDAQTLIYSAAVLPMLGVMGWAVLRRPLWARGAWAVILLVLLLHVVGLLVRQFTQGGQRSGDLTTAGLADAVFAVAYGTALAAFVIMVRKVRRRPEPLWSIDATIAFIVVWTLGAELILVPLAAQGASWFPMGIQMFYLSVNSGLVALAVRLGLTCAKGINRALRLGLLGVSIFAVNDIVSTSGLITGTQVGVRNGVYTALNIVVIAFSAAAASDPTSWNAPSKTPHEGRLSPSRAVLAVVLVFIVVATVAYQFTDEPGEIGVLLLFLVGLLIALLGARSVALVSAYRQLVRRETSLRSATARMLDAEQSEGIDVAFDQATRTLLPDDRLTWRWREFEAPQVSSEAGKVTLDQDPAPVGDGGLIYYRYGFALEGDELVVELVTGLLLDPLDWTGEQALVETAVQARARQRLREEREQAAEAARMSGMLAGAQDMVVLVDENRYIKQAMGAVADLTGYPPDYWVDRQLGGLFEDDSEVLQQVASGGRGRKRVLTRLSTTAAAVEATVVTSESGEVSVSLHDVTDRLKLTSELEYRAHYDVLTGLPNRTYLESLLAEHSQRWRAGGPPFAVIYVDIDDFKVVNDSLGHRLGDALLSALANKFSLAVRDRGVVARLGGDEFAVLLPDSDVSAALELGEHLVNEVLADPLTIEDVEILVRASAGVAASEDRHVSDGETVLQAADLALYDARAKGKGRVAPFRAELMDLAARKLHDANAVTAAARERAFRFDYQPIVNIESRDVVALEALMRWDRGQDLQRPDAFIPIAESLGELTRMLRDALPTALLHLRAWREAFGEVRLAVNVHAGALADADFVHWLTGAIAEASLPAEAVIVEVSERSLVPVGADRTLTSLRDAGVPIWIDDFGTGWSNLSSLERLPVTGVKLARELVVDDAGGVKTELVSAVLQLAEAVGFVVTAEGVETTEQMEQLARLGVTVVQGFLVGRPMSAADAQEWLGRFGQSKS